MGADYLGGKAGNYLPDWTGFTTAQREQERADSPAATETGELAVDVPAAGYGLFRLGAGGAKWLSEKLAASAKANTAAEGLRAGTKAKSAAEIAKQEADALAAASREGKITQAQTSVAGEAATAARKEVEAQKALDELNAKYAKIPQASDEQFAGDLRKSLSDYVKKYTEARQEASGFTKMLRAAGAYRRIKTSSVIDEISGIQKTRKSPQILSALDRVKSMLTNTDVVNGAERRVATLSVEQAHDAKMEVDNMISSAMLRTETGAAVPLDKATVAVLRGLKKRLTSTIADQYKEYGKSLSAFAKASRPLDVVERNANIRKLTSIDPYSEESKVLASDFVGRLLGQSNKGSKILSVLVKQDPELKNTARMYFARQLFGKAPPTDAGFKNFLFSNQGKLKEAGLLEEFSDIRKAKNAAEVALATAKEVSPAKLESILRTAETPEQIATRGRESVSPLTPSSASGRLKSMLSGATAEREAAENTINQYKILNAKLDTMPARDAVGEINKFYEGLARDKVISPDEYRQYREQISEIDKMYADNEAAKAHLKKILWTTAGVIGAGELARRGAGMVGY